MGISVFHTVSVFVISISLATMSTGVLNIFEVTAADNCDSTSTCGNTDLGGSSQNNNCVSESFCQNEGTSSTSR